MSASPGAAREIPAGPQRRPGPRRILTYLLVAATAYYLYVSVSGNLDQLRRFPWNVDLPRLLLSLAAHVAVLAAGVWVWARVLRHFEHPTVSTPTLMRIWFLSNLARYVPGKVFQFVVAGQLASAAGLSGAVLLTSLLVHTGFSLLGAAVISAWTLVGPLFPRAPATAAGLLVTVLAGLCVHPRVLNGGLGLIPRLLKRSVIRWNGGWVDGLLLIGYSVGTWGAYGAAYWLLLGSLAPVRADALLVLTGVNAFSFLAGYLALTPAGIGAREFVMTTLLIPLVGGPGIAAVLAVAARLWTVAAELIGGAAVLVPAVRSATEGGARLG